MTPSRSGWRDPDGSVRSTIGSFKALRAFANFDGVPEFRDESGDSSTSDSDGASGDGGAGALPTGIKLGYTINLHLPATSDVAVFNAIFKSLKEHLLR